MMRCTNCGLPLSPERTLTNCPRCGIPLNMPQGAQPRQFEPAGWGNMGGMVQQPSWQPPVPPNNYQGTGSEQSGPVSPGMARFYGGMGNGPQQQSALLPRRPFSPPQQRTTSRMLFMIAGLCIALGALILSFVAIISFSGSGGAKSGHTASVSLPTSAPTSSESTPQEADTPSPTASTSPSATSTANPGQQYITDAQMVANDPSTSAQLQPTTTFKVGSNMYVVFHLSPPGQGGAVCTYWYLNGNANPVTTYQQAIKSTSRQSYTYAIYGSPGQAYVELYWASDKTCSDKVLAQHVDFTVTA